MPEKIYSAAIVGQIKSTAVEMSAESAHQLLAAIRNNASAETTEGLRCVGSLCEIIYHLTNTVDHLLAGGELPESSPPPRW